MNHTMRFRLLTENGTSKDLRRLFGLCAFFKREDGSVVQKYTYTIVHLRFAIVSVLLTDEEIQSLQLGDAQSFDVFALIGDSIFKAEFKDTYSVRTREGRKVIE